jgi:CRISPR/Cas system-associated exonuclease Cas4 (RecB family)
MSERNDYLKLLTMNGRVLPTVAIQILKDRDARESTRDTAHIHPSDLAKRDWCPRANWYTIREQPKDPENFAFQRLNVFAEGHYIHAKWQDWLNHAGVLEGWWQCSNTICNHKWEAISPKSCPSCGTPYPLYREVPLSNEEHMILGHADGIINDANGRALIEIKSVGLGTVRFEAPDLFNSYQKGDITLDGLWKKIRQPFPSHIKQGLLYMYCTGIHEMVYLYEWKPTQEVKEFVVGFTPELVQPMLDNCKRLMTALQKDIPPMRPMWAESSSSTGCKYCSYKKTCWRSEDDNDNDEPDTRNGFVPTKLSITKKTKRSTT